MAMVPGSPDFAPFDAWMQRWPNARNYRIALGVSGEFGGYKMGTAGFNQTVGAWVSAYAAHWRHLGLNLNQIGLLLTDEPQTTDQANKIMAWAKAIHTAQPEILVWEDPCPSYTYPTAYEPVFDVCDVLCLHRPHFVTADDTYRTSYRKQRAAGRTLNFYSASGPTGWYDPYSYYRLQAWSCWDEGATAMFFWAFSENGGASSWNEYLSASNYTPFFLDDHTVTAGKPMEAIREGVEDYQYLTMLKAQITQLKAKGTSPAQVIAAEALLTAACRRVLDAKDADQLFWSDEWSGQKDRDVADAVRIEVLNMLETLTSL